MSASHKVLSYLQRVSCKLNKAQVAGEPQVASEPQQVVNGWDKYATEWNPAKFPVLPGYRLRYVGDEWTAEDVSAGGTTYGLAPDIIENFEDYINKYLLNPFLPSYATEGLEIGPGGGRLTVLLVPRTKVLHLAEASEAMLRHLKGRFVGVNNLHYYHTDGMTLPALQPGNLDYVIAFDVFVHFEARLIYWYLRQVAHLLKPGGTGIIHYANVLTPIGWHEFEIRLESNVQRRHFAAFGVMCPQLMARFLEALELDIISSDTGLIPRDAIAVFRKPLKNGTRVMDLSAARSLADSIPQPLLDG